MKTIIVATDFSTSAMNAASYAADMALAIQANLLLLHIYQIPVEYFGVPIVSLEDEIMNDAKKSMSSLEEKIKIRTEGKVSFTTEFSGGIFFQELEAACEKVNPYVVIIGSQGTTAADHLLYGGHATYAMKHLRWPLITVPPKANFLQIKKICLACDFDEVIDSTPVNEIIELVNNLHAELHVIYSGKETSPDPELVFESGLLQEMLLPVNPQYHFIEDENAEESIINFVEKNKIDLLITLPKRRVLLKEIIHKSFSKKLILHSQVPVLALHSTTE